MGKNTEVAEGSTDANQRQGSPPQAEVNPFILRTAYPDPQGLLDTRYSSLEEMKDSCLVVLDASALLLPYVLGQVTLGKVVDVYRPLAEQGRLVVPAQAVREFAKNRSSKIADIVRHLQNRASGVIAPVKQNIGILADDPDYKEIQELSDRVGELAKSIQAKVRTIVERISSQVGKDPVSEAYRGIFKGCVRDEKEPVDEDAFRKDMTERYQSRLPPGYKDKGKSDGGAGDLLIWQTVLRAGEAAKVDCILVTGDTKPDWYTQSDGPFQPRLELIEEYRTRSQGCTAQIIPLSRLMELYGAGTEAITDTRNAELAAATPTIAEARKPSKASQSEDEWLALSSEQEDLRNQIGRARAQLASLPDDGVNTSLSLPWNRAAYGARSLLAGLLLREAAVRGRLDQIEGYDGLSSAD